MAMIDRPTKRDVDAAATVATVAARDAGIPDTDRWAVRHGSPTYGRAWRLVSRDPEHGGESHVLFLGTSRAEAYQSLYAMSETFRMARTYRPRSV